jgi:hypothetical protein
VANSLVPEGPAAVVVGMAEQSAAVGQKAVVPVEADQLVAEPGPAAGQSTAVVELPVTEAEDSGDRNHRGAAAA